MESLFKTIAEKHAPKLRTKESELNLLTVRSIARDCGVNPTVLPLIMRTYTFRELIIVDDMWDPYGSSAYDEAYALAEYIYERKDRFNKLYS